MFTKGDYIKHPKMDWGIGVIEGVSDKKNIDVLFEKVGRKKLSLDYITPILVDENQNVNIDFKVVESKTKVYSGPFIDIYDDIKSVYKSHLIIIENGCYFESLQEDAEYLSNTFGYKMYEQSVGVLKTGFPLDAQKIWKDLQALGKPYIVVTQLTTQSGHNLDRMITEVYPSIKANPND